LTRTSTKEEEMDIEVVVEVVTKEEEAIEVDMVKEVEDVVEDDSIVLIAGKMII
jgi:hypothetical protein